MEIYLDLVGGIAGDMFIAALLDAFPQHAAGVFAAVEALDSPCPVTCSLSSRHEVLRGKQFHVQRASAESCSAPFASAPSATAPSASAPSAGAPCAGAPCAPFAAGWLPHGHVRWSSIRSRISGSTLPADVKTHAIGIFELLAQAEAHVHGVPPDAVEFHEVGAWDSIADIVGAASLIAAVDATRWTASAAPLGSGRVMSAHGMLPVPAPATTRLLLGMATIDDGIAGERVTPTGAAILRYLCPPQERASRHRSAERTLIGCGNGFGTRRLAGVSNHLRVLCFEKRTRPVDAHRPIHLLEFEVDDQSAEELAAGLDRLRSHGGVLDVTQCAVYGKKGRMMMHVQVLARESHWEEVVELCFRETTTIGLRHHVVQGIGLERRFEQVMVDGHKVRVKIVERPGGATAKAESDDVRGLVDHGVRSSVRARAEMAALDR